MAEFKGWPSISRLVREVVVTEKIDGTNAAIHIERLKFDHGSGELAIRPGDVIDMAGGDLTFLRLTAQSRTRLITPKDDNHGFAKWVQDNGSALAAVLGEGIHYGEWWGYKINRGYGLAKGDKRFSLFNTERWVHLDGSQVPGLWSVPVLSAGVLLDPEILMDEDADFLRAAENPVSIGVTVLREEGSKASPGYDRPEGVVAFHTAGRVMFKYTLDGDAHKQEAQARDAFAGKRAADLALEPKMSREESIAYWDAVSRATETTALWEGTV